MRLLVGTKVRTVIDPDRVSIHWTPAALPTRKHDVEGIIEGVHDSHGLCYAVRHQFGEIGYYDPHELVVTGMTPESAAQILTQIREGKWSWMRIKRFVPAPDMGVHDRLAAIEKHHVEETTFLVEMVKQLCEVIENEHSQRPR